MRPNNKLRVGGIMIKRCDKTTTFSTLVDDRTARVTVKFDTASVTTTFVHAWLSLVLAEF